MILLTKEIKLSHQGVYVNSIYHHVFESLTKSLYGKQHHRDSVKRCESRIRSQYSNENVYDRDRTKEGND